MLKVISQVYNINKNLKKIKTLKKTTKRKQKK